MAVRTPAQIQTQYEALFAAMQADGSITAARFRSFWTDVQDTIFAASVMRSIVLGNGVIMTIHLADDAVTNDKLAQGAADRNALPDDVVNTAKLDDLAVTTAKMANAAVTGPKLAADQRVAAWARANAPTGRAPRLQTYGDVFVGARISGQVITFTQADGSVVTVTIPAGSGGGTTPPPASHTRYWGRSADTTFAAADFTGADGVSSTDDRFTLPTWTGNEYFAFAVPDDTGDINSLIIDGIEQFGGLQRVSGTLTIQGTAYKVWRSNNAVNLSGKTVTIGQA